MGKNKERKASYEESVRSAVESLHDAQRAARRTFDDAFERLERKASSRLERIVEDTREEANEVATALRGILEQAQSASTGLSESRARAEEDLGVIRVVRDASESLAERIDELDSRAAEFGSVFERVRGTADTTLEQIQWRLDEAMQAVDQAVVRADSEMTERVQALTAEIAEGLRSDAAAKLLGILTAGESAAQEMTEESRQRLDAAARQVEELATGLGEAIQRVERESDGRARALEDAVRNRTDEVGEEATRHAAELLVALEANVHDLELAARSRFEDVLGAFEEQSTAVLKGAVDEALALLEQTRREVDAAREEQARLELEMWEMTRQPDALAEPDDLSEPAPERAAGPELHVDDPEGDDSDDADDTAETYAADAPDEDEDPGGPIRWGTDAPMWVSPTAEATAPPTSGDENFFARLAAELRETADDGLRELGEVPPPVSATPSAPSAAEPPTTFVSPATGSVFSPARSVNPAAGAVDVLDMGRAVIAAPLALLSTSVRQLRTEEKGQLVRVEVRAPRSERSPARLLLTVFDARGWWEIHALPLTCEISVEASVVVDLAELDEALSAHGRFLGASDTTMVVHRDVEVGNFLLLAHAKDELVGDPAAGERVEQIDLQRLGLGDATITGVALETQVGRMRVPASLAAFLRRRRVERADLVMCEGEPRLYALARASSELVTVQIVGRLGELGHDDAVDAEDRRNRGDEVAQLVSALSAATSPDELVRILKVGVGYTRRKAASHPALPQEMIDDLLREGTEAMRAAAAANPSVGAEGLAIAVRDSAPSVRAAVAANPAMSEVALERLAKDPVAQVRARVTANPRVNPDLLAVLANDEDSAVRVAVASSTAVAVDTLSVLARDPDAAVCAAVAVNPGCPPELLTELVGIAPEAVLANPNVSKSLLAAGSLIDVPHLRAKVAMNPATPAKQLRALAADDEIDVLRAVAEHPATPPSARRRARRRLERQAEDTL